MRAFPLAMILAATAGMVSASEGQAHPEDAAPRHGRHPFGYVDRPWWQQPRFGRSFRSCSTIVVERDEIRDIDAAHAKRIRKNTKRIIEARARELRAAA